MVWQPWLVLRIDRNSGIPFAMRVMQAPLLIAPNVSLVVILQSPAIFNLQEKPCNVADCL